MGGACLCCGVRELRDARVAWIHTGFTVHTHTRGRGRGVGRIQATYNFDDRVAPSDRRIRYSMRDVATAALPCYRSATTYRLTLTSRGFSQASYWPPCCLYAYIGILYRERKAVKVMDAW